MKERGSDMELKSENVKGTSWKKILLIKREKEIEYYKEKEDRREREGERKIDRA